MQKTCTNCETINDIIAKYCSVCGHKLPEIEVNVDNKKSIKHKVEKKAKLDWKFFPVFIISFTTVFFITNHFFSNNIEKKLQKSANEINKNCPMQVDQYTILENATALSNKTFQYNYKLVGLSKAEVNLDTVKKYVFTSILENAKSNPDLQEMRDSKTTLNYYYRDKNGVFVVKYVVTPDMYN